MLAFSAVSVLFLYGFLRLQDHLLLSLGFPAVTPDQAFNTAASFVTNTNWQSYSGESTMGHLVQMAGLAVQNFVSAAVGIAVVAALIRGLHPQPHRPGRQLLGGPDPDRACGCCCRSRVVFAIVLVAGGVIAELPRRADRSPRSPASTQTITGGPVASQEAIKELGTNGGGFYNANSAHPFENPNGFTNLLEIYLLLVISFSLPRTFGKMVGDHRQGYAILVGDGPDLGRLGRADHRQRAAQRGQPRRAPGRRHDGGQGAAVRHLGLRAVRRVHHADLHRCGQLLPRLVHAAAAAG